MDIRQDIDEENLSIFINHNVPSSKNGRTVYNGHLTTSAAVMKWKRLTHLEFTSKKETFLRFWKSLGSPRPWFIEFTFVKSKDVKFDYLGPAETVQDAMTRHGWTDDDSVYDYKPYFGDYQVNREKPGVYIRILKNKPIYLI